MCVYIYIYYTRAYTNILKYCTIWVKVSICLSPRGHIKTFWSHLFGLLCITAKGSGETTGSCVCSLAAYVVAGDSQGELTHSDDFNYQWPCTMSNNWAFTRVPRFEPFLVWFGKHFGGSKRQILMRECVVYGILFHPWQLKGNTG